MNSLSWLIYIINVIPNVTTAIIFFSLTVFFISGAASLVMQFGSYHTDSIRERGHKLIKVPIICGFVLLLTAFVPGKEALYMIAASETGEVVANSEEGKELISDLKQVLKAQLEKMKE